MTDGLTVSAGPIRCFYRPSENRAENVTAGFAVVRTIRSAVHRNRVKRLMRESWRLHREDLENSGLQVVFLYNTPTPKKDLRLETIDAAMQRLIAKLNQLNLSTKDTKGH